MRIRKLLLPTDGSEPARAAENMAVAFCNSMPECEIEVVTVIHPRQHIYSRSVPFCRAVHRRRRQEGAGSS